jgi:hypothetical protein
MLPGGTVGLLIKPTGGPGRRRCRGRQVFRSSHRSGQITRESLLDTAAEPERFPPETLRDTLADRRWPSHVTTPRRSPAKNSYTASKEAAPHRQLSNETAAFASCYGPLSRSPKNRAFDTGLQPCRVPELGNDV